MDTTNRATAPGIRTRVARAVAAATLAAVALSATACKLDLDNPNAPTREEIVTNADGIIAVAPGMQGQFAQTIDDYVVTNSLVTDEWGTRSLALISYVSLLTGENFDPGYDIVLTPFSRSYQVILSANTILEGTQNVSLGVATTAGMNALARLFKAMALGMLAQQYQRVPVEITAAGGVPRERAEVLDTVLVLLERARADIANVSDASLAEFRSLALAPGIDLRNTIDAMLARYYLIDGQYAQAIAAADRVNLGVLSELRYPSPTRNPIENLAFQLRYVGGLQSFVNQAEAGDRRPAYWLQTTATTLPANPPDTVLRPLRKFSTPNEAFPLYLPDEMKLIKAEALTRQGPTNYAAAATLINEVRTQTTSAVDEPVAGLPAIPLTSLATEAQLLDQIAYERRYELYMQGLRWEDTRRLGTQRTTTPTFTFLPLPVVECQANPEQPCG
ncbi:MAG: RagB/SusD family nutrient uptake outer membrane protein [Gemmatimonadaceae bacterium]